MNRPVVNAIPIGEADSDLVRSEVAAITAVFDRIGADLSVAGPEADEAGACQAVQRLAERNPDLLLLIPLRGLSAPIIEKAAQSSAAPCLIWPVQGRYALPSSALAAGALRDSGIPVELFYAPPGLPETIARIGCLTRAATAFSRIRKSRIGVIGGLFPNLVSCRYDPQTVRSRLGVTLVPISFGDLRELIQSMSRSEEVERALREIAGAYTVRIAGTNALEAGIRLHLALKQAAQEHELDGFATECWTGFPRELGLNPCLGFVEDRYTLACEGDVMLCIGLLIARFLTGESAYAGDLFDLDMDGTITLAHCGAPASLDREKKEVVLAPSQLASERGFETATVHPRIAPGPVTLMRYYGRDCDRMHVAFGELTGSESLPSLTVKVRLAGDRWKFLGQCSGNHYIVVGGDIRAELNLLGKWLGITIIET